MFGKTIASIVGWLTETKTLFFNNSGGLFKIVTRQLVLYDL